MYRFIVRVRGRLVIVCEAPGPTAGRGNNFLKPVDWLLVYTTPDASAALPLLENIPVSSMEQFLPFRTYGTPPQVV